MAKQNNFSKVPEVTLIFWLMKIIATTLGETGGDAVSMSMNLGYLVGTGILVFGVLLAAIAAAHYWTNISHTMLFWAAFILTRPLSSVVSLCRDRAMSDVTFWDANTLSLIQCISARLHLRHQSQRAARLLHSPGTEDPKNTGASPGSCAPVLRSCGRAGPLQSSVKRRHIQPEWTVWLHQEVCR
jgi:uncharacterized membrane-anchored protein